LTQEALGSIVEIQLSRVERSLADRKLTLSVTARARERLARIGYDPDFGARPLKRAIQRAILDPLSVAILSGKFKPGQHVKVDLGPSEREFVFESA
jgi:ATP-dependent Clp protease ATP-binding subunit ClpB